MSHLLETIRKRIGNSERIYEAYNTKFKGTLTEENIKNKHQNKDEMASTIITLIKCLGENIVSFRESFVEIEDRREECKRTVDKIVGLQEQLIEAKTTALETVKKAVEGKVEEVKFEMERSYCDIAKVNTTQPTMKKIEKVINKAVKAASGKIDTDLNLIVYGLPEEEEQSEEEDEKILQEMLRFTEDQDELVIEKHFRIGEHSTGSNRPVRLIMRSSKERTLLLTRAKELRNSSSLNRLFVCPDLTPEERKERKSLVEKMKHKIKQDPSKHYYIYRGEVLSKEKPGESNMESRVYDIGPSL